MSDEPSSNVRVSAFPAADRWHSVSVVVPADGYMLVWPTEQGVPEVWAAKTYHEALRRGPVPGWAHLAEAAANITHWTHLPPFPPAAGRSLTEASEDGSSHKSPDHILNKGGEG